FRSKRHPRRPRHALHTAGDEAITLIRTDGVHCADDRLEAGPAQSVHRLARDLDRKSSDQRGETPDVATVFTSAIGAPEDHIVDRRRIQAGAFDQRADHSRSQIVGAHGRKRAPMPSDGSAHGVHDHRVAPVSCRVHSGTTAVASISTTASASTRPQTIITDIAGKCRPIISRYASPIWTRASTYAWRSVTNHVIRTRCSGRASARASTATMLRSACAVCRAKSELSITPVVGFQPIWPAIEITRPRALIPFAYPRGASQPSGWITSVSFMVLLPSIGNAEAFPYRCGGGYRRTRSRVDICTALSRPSHSPEAPLSQVDCRARAGATRRTP